MTFAIEPTDVGREWWVKVYSGLENTVVFTGDVAECEEYVRERHNAAEDDEEEPQMKRRPGGWMGMNPNG